MNFARLEDFRSFDPDFSTVRAIVRLFMTDVPMRIDAIAQAHERRDAGGLSEAAHALRGAAANVGANALAAMSAAIEAQAEIGAFAPDAGGLRQQLQDCWDGTRQQLEAWQNGFPAEKTS